MCIDCVYTHLEDDSTFLQKIRTDVSSSNVLFFVKLELNVLPESRGIVVSDRLSISQSLKFILVVEC